MRILHILDHSIPLHSGYTFRTRAIVEEQRRMGYETFHITSAKHNGYEAAAEEIDGLLFYRTPEPVNWYRSLPILNHLAIVDSLTHRLHEVIEEIRPDILHAHSPALNGLAALRAGKRHGLPVVYECRAFWEDAAVNHGTSKAWGLRYFLTKAAENWVFRHVQAITTICGGLKTDILGRGIAPEKVTIIPNAVDTGQFALSGKPDPELRQRLGLNDMTVLGFIGSFYAYEGLSLLFEALPGILARTPNVRILLVGGGPENDRLKDLAVRLKIKDKIIFVGRVPHGTVQAYYNQVDVFVYPRYSMRLTELVTPLKPLEAMAEGRLVIASDVGGHRELIRDGETGWLFKAGDVKALTERVLAVLDGSDTWPAVKEAGRAFIETERNWRHTVAGYRDVYGRCLAPSPSEAARPAN